jgi:hypothetical protein
MGRAPAAQLLGNGEILVPVKGESGDWRVCRLEPDEEGYAAWLAQIQDANRPAGLVERALTFWGVGLLLLFGIPIVLALLVLLGGAVR